MDGIGGSTLNAITSLQLRIIALAFALRRKDAEIEKLEQHALDVEAENCELHLKIDRYRKLLNKYSNKLYKLQREGV